MRQSWSLRILLVSLGTLAWVGSSAVPVQAVPSYARQTGFSCAQCHTVYPELTPLGRRFKLTGYLLTTTPSQGTAQEEYVLNRTPPISAMVQVSATQTEKDIPDNGTDTSSTSPGGRAQNNTVAFPQAVSLFYAGRISPNTGAFIQVTYTGADDHFTIDNTDIRIVDQGALGSSQFVYGLTINNNPGVQDLWNSTPAFGFPYALSASAPTPSASIQLDGSLGQQVAGIGAYAALLQGSSYLYAEFSVYRAAQIGTKQPLDSNGPNPVLRENAPYLRVAYEVNWATTSLEVGAIGMHATLLPTNVPVMDPSTGVQAVDSNGLNVHKALNQVDPNRYYDSGIDAQVQYIPSDEHIFTAKGLWLHEDQSLGADSGAAHASNYLDTTRITGSYYHNRSQGFSAQWFNTVGSQDSGLYVLNRTNTPDSSGYIIELIYNPYLNVRYSLQYTVYEKFNGAAINYDGYGRDATDNNTYYLLAWLMF